MSSLRSISSAPVQDEEQKKLMNLYTELNERMKIINDKMLALEGNFRNLSSKSSHLNAMLSPLIVELQNKYTIEE